MEQFLTELESRLETNDDQWWFDVDHGTDMLTSAYDVCEDPNEELLNACRDGHVGVVRNAIMKGANVNPRRGIFQPRVMKTPLMIACEKGHSEVAKILIDKGANLGATTGWWRRTPLMIACEKGHSEIAKILIDKGENLEATDILGRTPLMIACEKGCSEIAKTLIDKGANLEATDYQWKTPLMLARENGHSEMAKILVDKGANLEAIAIATDYWTRVDLETLRTNVYNTVPIYLPPREVLRKVLRLILRYKIKGRVVLRRRSKRDILQLCISLSELVSLLKSLRSGWGPPLDLLVRMVNSNFWVMEADMWADLLILARWSNPTINREDVLCNICKDVWIQPTTLYCGHVFCASCLQTWINDHKECPTCHKEIKGVMTFSDAAEKLLMNYYKERRVSFEKFNSTCVKACIFCEPPPQQESVQLHECSVDEVSTRPIIKNTQEKVTEKRQRGFESESPETKRRKLSPDTSKDGPTVLKVNTHLLHVKRAIREARVRWKDIGRGLHLLDGDIRSIREEDDEECLHKVLSLWMETGSATIYQLLEALENPPVSRKDIAGEIRSLKGEERSRVGL